MAKNVSLHFLTLYVLRFAVFNPICTITLYVIFLTLYVILFAFFNPIQSLFLGAL